MGFFQNLLKDAAGAFFGSDYLRDYTHASKTFRTNSYQYAPKLKFSFHTYFDINPEAFEFDQNLSTGQNFGLLVQEVQLPSYRFDVKEYNQYNRKRLVQTKIHYEPVKVTFFDDNSNLINKLWAGYYTYYYKDGANPQVVFAGSRGGQASQDLSIPPAPNTSRGLAGAGGGIGANPTLIQYNNRNLYDPSITGNTDWGYIGETSKPSGPDPKKVPFFKNITIFGFNQKNFIAYTLINPIISSFNHDSYNYEEGNGVMKNTMTIDYETVVYNEGAIDGKEPGNIVTGFGDQATYDRKESPIAKPGSNATILGQGGLKDAAGGFINDLSGGTVGSTIRAIQTAGTAYNTFKNVNLKSLLKAEATTMLRNSLQSQPNQSRNLQFEFTSPAATPGSAGSAGSPPIGARTSPEQLEEVTIRSQPVLAEVQITSQPVLAEVQVTGRRVTAGVQSNTGFYVPPSNSLGIDSSVFGDPGGD